MKLHFLSFANKDRIAVSESDLTYSSDSQPFRYRVPPGDFLLHLRTTEFNKKYIYSN